MNEEKNLNFNEYTKSIHRLGKISVFIVIISFIFVPLGIGIFYNINVNVKQTLFAIGSILSFMGPLAIGEFLGYAPILGSSLYLSLMTGNTTNMKIPIVISSLEMEKIDPNSEEAELIKIIAVGTSSLFVILALFISIFLITPIMPIIDNPILTPAFNNIIPCMMGALFIPEFLKNPKNYIFPTIFVLVLTLILGFDIVNAQQSFVLIATIMVFTMWVYFRRKM